MGYKYYNPNPLGLSVGDCTIRAISKVIERDWKETYLCLIVQGYQMYDMPSANRVWGEFLRSQGFVRRGMDSGNSYRYSMVYPMYDNRYSRTGEDREEMKHEMMKLMESTNDEKMRKSILEVMNKM